LGSHFDDRLVGNGKPNILKGRDGDDRLYGKGKPDTLVGGKGNDYGDGGAGTDVCKTETKVNCP
jgi:Ca2+-binding RTX toxin-like protein